ncbi:MAG: ACT domain-containing protein, partial [Myxococcales bacterium]|nr:ACT domain-containing protein [Myxococcales bacterium]
SNGVIKNAVNVPALPPEIAERIQPYITLAGRLGSLLGQLEQIDVKEIRVTCTGEAGELGVTPIARSALSGILSHHLEERVNPVSAPFEAQDRGIKLVEVKEPAVRGYGATVRVTLTGDKGLHTAIGAIGSHGEPRLTGLEGYEMDAQIQGRMLVMRNKDRPGVIGAVGTVLGKHAINVSRMQLGLDEKTGQALALYTVDHDVSNESLDELRSIENVSAVILVTV